MLRKKKKFFKILSVLVAVIIAFSLFSFNVSAETKETVYTDFWTLSTADSKVWILDTQNNGVLTDITENVKFATLSSGKLMGVEFKANQNWGANNILYFNFYFDMRTEYSNPGVSSLKFTLYQWNGGRVLYSGTDPNVNTGKVYSPWAYRDGHYNIDGTPRRDYQETFSEPNAAKTAVTYQFNNQNAEYGFKRVCVFAYCTLVKPLADSSYKVYFEFGGLDYRYSTMGEYLNMQIVENQNYNTDRVIANADKNASQIQANADKNASQIQANQDKNTNKVINGGSDNPHYSGADTSATDDYAAKEEELNNKTVLARSSTVSFFNNFGALLNDTNVSRGLLAVSKVMTELFSVGWIAGIIQFSLALGAFAFILGSVIMVVGKLSGKESRDTRNQYYKAKTDYYNSRRNK